MSWRVLVLVAVMVAVCAFPHGGQNRTSAGVIGQIISEGYPAELHHVTTEDGYILGVHRIPYGKAGPSAERRPVVFVMHGLMGASNNFIFLGKENAIAYNLADAGYDVWMGNARGNIYSRAHVTLNPDNSREKYDFFDFSWEEISIIDVPAMVDYAMAVTGETKVHYVGHSQGGTSFLVLNTMKPEYNEKFASAHLLAGVGYMNNFPNSQLRTVATFTNTLYSLGTSLGLVEISNLSDLPIDFLNQGYTAADYCVGDVTYRDYCKIIGFERFLDQMDVEGLGLGGASLKQFAHYGQNIKDKAFRRWDHGLLTNRQVYGTFAPPAYDLSLITVPTVMHYTVSDVLLNEQDVLAMSNVMPNTLARKIARESFTHVDFITAADVKQLVTNYLIDRLHSIDTPHATRHTRHAT